jgi:hypothetical protein
MFYGMFDSNALRTGKVSGLRERGEKEKRERQTNRDRDKECQRKARQIGGRICAYVSLRFFAH